MKAKNGLYNVLFGFLGQIITIAIGLIIPRLFIVSLGSEANGLLASISQIFVYLGLLEAGIGVASVQSLYKPIANENKEGINKILSATHNYYTKCGIYYLIAVVILGIVYPYIIYSSFSNIDVFLIIVFTGAGGAINFLFQGKYRVLLMAEGKAYILSNIATLVTIITSVTKVILLLLGFNVVIIQFFYFIIGLVQIGLINIYINKNYKWINFNVTPDYDSISQKGSALIHQISAMIFSNTDVLIITVFCGLKVSSVYAIYNLIITYISGFLGNVNGGIVFILGQMYQEDREAYLKINDAYDTYYMALTFAIYTVAYVLILPFMSLYTEGITDISYIDPLLPALFIFIQILSAGRAGANNAINVAGHFRKTQNRAIVETIINIIVSLICVNLFGIYGVLMGTITALLYRVNDIILYSCKYILFRSPRKTYLRWIVNLVTMVIIVGIINQFNMKIDSYIKLIISGSILSLTIIPIYILIASILNIDSFKYVKNIISSKFNISLNKMSGSRWI